MRFKAECVGDVSAVMALLAHSLKSKSLAGALSCELRCAEGRRRLLQGPIRTVGSTTPAGALRRLPRGPLLLVITWTNTPTGHEDASTTGTDSLRPGHVAMACSRHSGFTCPRLGKSLDRANIAVGLPFFSDPNGCAIAFCVIEASQTGTASSPQK